MTSSKPKERRCRICRRTLLHRSKAETVFCRGCKPEYKGKKVFPIIKQIREEIKKVADKTGFRLHYAARLRREKPAAFFVCLFNPQKQKPETMIQIVSRHTGKGAAGLQAKNWRNPSKFFNDYSEFLRNTQYDPEIKQMAKDYILRQENELDACILEIKRSNTADPRERIKFNQRIYNLRNFKTRRDAQKAYQSKTANRIMHNLRTRVRELVKRANGPVILNQGSFKNIVGCPPRNFFLFLESMFEEGMNWKNYGEGEGKWSIDHIICLNYFKQSWQSGDKARIQEASKLANHFMNLVPVWSSENKKKKDKMPKKVTNRGSFLWSDLHEQAYERRKVYYDTDEEWEESCFWEERNLELMEKYETKTEKS